MADLDSLIGSRISLISHQDIRYDGVLFSINQAESSIVLKDVQVFGTEDRVSDKSKTVPPSTQVIAFVTFPGQEIKDLYVHEASTPPPAPAAATAPPAPPKTETKRNNNNNNTNNSSNNQSHGRSGQQSTQNNNSSSSNNNNRSHANHRQEDKPKSESAATTTQAAKKEGPAPANTGAPKSEVGTGGHLLKFREKKNGTTAANPVEATTEFDFEGGLKTFNKDEVLAEVAVEKSEISKYTKDDFFDNFSKTTSGEVKARLTAAEERKLNTDTFGAIALQSGYRRGGRGGGRGRGRSYGGGRGGGRGRSGNGGYRSGRGNFAQDA